MAKIVIIDDLIDPKGLIHIDSFCVIDFVKKQHNEAIAYQEKTHGTVCAQIIDRLTEHYDLINIRILESQYEPAEIELLRDALLKCLEIKPDIIHLSVGSIRLSDTLVLEVPIRNNLENGTAIVSAGSNQEVRSIPAAYHGVIGVKSDKKELLPKGRFQYSEDKFLGTQLIVNNYLVGEIEGCNRSNSYAAPVITALVNTMLNQSVEQKRIFELLRQECYKDVSVDEKYRNGLKTAESVPRVGWFVSNGSQTEEAAVKLANQIFEKYGYEVCFLLDQEKEVKDVRGFQYKHDISLTKQLSLIETYTMCDLILVLGNKGDNFIQNLDVICDTKEKVIIVNDDKKYIYRMKRASGNNEYIERIIRILLV